jgi:hypothetical protein
VAKQLTAEDVVRISVDEGLPPQFALNVWQTESGRGSSGKLKSVDKAHGPFQVLEGTFKEMMPSGNIHDIFDNARAGIRYLKKAYDKNGGDPAAVYATYHSGSPGFYTRRGLKKDGLNTTTLSYTMKAIGHQDDLAKDAARIMSRIGIDASTKAPQLSMNDPALLDTGESYVDGGDVPAAPTDKDAFLSYPQDTRTPTQIAIADNIDSGSYGSKTIKAMPKLNPVAPYAVSNFDSIDRQLLKLIKEV